MTEDEREKKIGIMTNAIAWVLEGGEGSDELTVSLEQVDLYKEAAERAYRQAIEGEE